MTTTSPRVLVPGNGAGNSAALDSAHLGDIRGALGTISLEDSGARTTASAKLKTLLAIVGPGLIVMVGDNDAGAFSTYGQAGQTYGTKLLWTFLLLIPVLYVNQEMVLRLGAVTGVGHARLILERFGRFWGAFSVIDLFILNALTIVTEFIGIALAASYLGVPKIVAVIIAGLIIVLAASTGSFRRFERVAMFFCVGSLLLVPLYVFAHPPIGQMARGFAIPSIPGGAGHLSTVMLLIIGIVGTTVAPWQLFFQQSYVIDKRITPRFMRYEKVDLWIGIVIVVIGGSALMGATAAAFGGHSHAQFTDAAGLAAGLSAYAGHAVGALFAVALLDASMIGAFAVSLSTAYAIGDVLGLKHSLHRGIRQAKGFYAMYAALIAIAAAIVLIPGSPLGLLTVAVQVLAGVLLPSATVFLLLLCNDKEVLGPWVNGRATNALAGLVIGLLVMLSGILMVSVLFGRISVGAIIAIVVGCACAAAVTGGYLMTRGWRARGGLGLTIAWLRSRLADLGAARAVFRHVRGLRSTGIVVRLIGPANEAGAGKPGRSEKVASEKMASEKMASEKVASEKVASEKVAAVPRSRQKAAASSHKSEARPARQGAVSRQSMASRQSKENWRMPPLAILAPVQMSVARRIGMAAMWIYLGSAFALVVVRVVELALNH